MILRIIGYGLLATALALILIVMYRNSRQSTMPLTYSPEQMLSALWSGYKQSNLEPGTYRTLDQERADVTTSEGQSYSMLRAVWMGDKPTFDAEWQWTESNLARPNDTLFSWLWGKHTDGTYGVLTEQGGQNSASDADTNIALALTFAYARWQDQSYLSSARAIVNDIWNEETLTIGGHTYLLADNVEKSSASDTALINPSYLSPAAYRIFAQVDAAHPWMHVVDSTYYVLSESAVSGSSGTSSRSVPPDWIALSKSTGEFSAPRSPGTDTNFGYDALRIPWNLAIDDAWFHDPRDKTTAKQFAFLGDAWQANGKLAAGYDPSGTPASNYNYETPAMYGGAIGYFMLTDPAQADRMYANKLAYLFTPDWSGWRQSLSYYDDNWAWFGIGLYAHILPNLAAGLPTSFFATSR